MKLYIYDHCPYCLKARMIFGLKNIPVELHVLLNDDAETPTRMVGQKTGSHSAKKMTAAICQKAWTSFTMSINSTANRY